MPATLVNLVVPALHTTARYIHFTTEDRFKGFLALLLQLFVHLVTLVKKVFHAKHIAVIRYRHTLHAVCYGTLHQVRHFTLSV